MFLDLGESNRFAAKESLLLSSETAYEALSNPEEGKSCHLRTLVKQHFAHLQTAAQQNKTDTVLVQRLICFQQ